MNEKTKHDYQHLAAHFYGSRLNGKPPTPKRLADALKACAGDYRPGYWRRLRSAIAYDQERQGFIRAAERVRGTENPVTARGDQVPARQRRAKSVSDQDTERLTTDLMNRGDQQSWAAVVLARWTGARPAEMPGVKIQGDQIQISGAKKSHDGNRGADRVITLGDPEGLEQVRQALEILTGVKDMGPIQDRVSAAGRRLWPQRKAVPSLYTWRHQVGSDLKASGLSRRAVAYLMGHQSTQSVEVYGRRNRGVKTPLRIAQNVNLEGVREKHSEPPSSRQDVLQTLENSFKAQEGSPRFGFTAGLSMKRYPKPKP